MKNTGFTLIELMITMAIVVIIITAIFSTHLRILKGFKAQTKIAETQMQHTIGLELSRYDIEMTGYGLPYSVSVAYPEAASDTSYTPNPSSFNSNPPAAFSFSDDGNTNASNSDVLVIRSAVANISETSKKWGHIDKDGVLHEMGPTSFASNERVIALDAVNNKNLIVSGGNWFYKFNTDPLPTPPTNSTIYLIYGIDPDTDLRMPFNRVDYYLKQPFTLPARCNPNSYILYRAAINQGDGKRNENQPLLDCVMDFQVAFGEDSDGDSAVDTWITDLSGLSASDIRTKIKEVRAFVIVQEGQRDPGYNAPNTITLGDNDTGILSTLSPSGDDVHYRWKVLKIAVSPMNLKEK
jgi:type IV pilus assembly protein PilW